MKQLSTSRTLCVFRHGPSLSPYRRTNSFFRLPQALSSQHFFALASFRTLRVICCAPPHHLSTPLRHPSVPFNLHRARVRRNRGRLPSSRCIESAQTRHARAPTSLHRASDTTLGLPITNPPKLPRTPFRALLARLLGRAVLARYQQTLGDFPRLMSLDATPFRDNETRMRSRECAVAAAVRPKGDAPQKRVLPGQQYGTLQALISFLPVFVSKLTLYAMYQTARDGAEYPFVRAQGAQTEIVNVRHRVVRLPVPQLPPPVPAVTPGRPNLDMLATVRCR